MAKKFFQSLKELYTTPPAPAQVKTARQEPRGNWPSEAIVVTPVRRVERHPLMPSESDYKRHCDAFSRVESQLSSTSYTFRTASTVLTEGWMLSPATGTYINGSMLMQMPIVGRSGNPVASYELWIVHRENDGSRYAQLFELREYWACQITGPKTTTWEDFQLQPLEYDVVAPQIFKLFEIATRLKDRPEWLAEVLLATIRRHHRGVLGDRQRKAADALSLEYLGKKFSEEQVLPAKSSRAISSNSETQGAETKPTGNPAGEDPEAKRRQLHDELLIEATVTAKLLQEQGRTPSIFADNSGELIVGWNLDEGNDIRRSYAWWRSYKILTTTGKLFYLHVSSTNDKTRELEQLNTLKLQEGSLLAISVLLKQVLKEPVKPIEPPSSQEIPIEESPPPKRVKASKAKGGHEKIVLPETASSSDPEDKFRAQTQATVSQLMNLGKPKSSYKDDNGNSVEGWVIESYQGYHDTKHYGSKDFRESWGGGYLILTPGGEFYSYRWDYEDQSFEPKEVRSHTLGKVSTHSLAGSKGEPFSEIIAKLKHLPYRG